ncbi:MAG: acetyl-CoA carboxylase biotin carboxyl carrier protein [Kiritimatiellaeota bacterium]|nr:acetyl-CoA carboxylase biotin carboxyl carrier protein [Kiritimatiellota bacterium]
MDMEQIRQVIDLMKANDLCEFEMEEEGFRIAVKRRNGAEPAVVLSPAAPAGVSLAPAAPADAPAAESGKKTVEIKSPIVGTFYRAPTPDTEPFVGVGAHLDAETVVCLVEAMKVMNEIKAEVKGTIRKVLAENATAVQFGQPLFLVELD